MSEKMKPNEGQPLEATMKVLKGKIKDEEITNFVNTIVSAKAAKPILATASLAMGLVFRIVHCEPKEKRWVFNEEIWGIGVAGIQHMENGKPFSRRRQRSTFKVFLMVLVYFR